MKINAIVLAGGKSSRMGQDKGLMPLSGKPMIAHVLEVVESLSERILIVSNQDEYLQFGYPVFKDAYLEKGPLAGIYTGLLNSDTEYNIVVSCDTPFITVQLLSYLIDKSKGFEVTLPIHQGRTEQLIGVYSKKCESIFKEEIEKDNLKIRDAISLLPHNFVEIDAQLDFYNPNLFKNLNSLKDL